MASFQSIRSGSLTHPLFDKFNSDHVTKFLEGIQTETGNEYKLKNTNRFFYLAYALLAIGVFIFLIAYLLPKDRGLLVTILQITVIFGAGFGSGYGIRNRKNKRN
ncbi:MAG: hypothetical protein ABI550_00540 [Ignavibacteriaceae bacterium]